MAQLILSLLLDGLMALLLIITTYYCWRLNKRIRILQDSKSELAQIIRQFDESTQRATHSIGEIHEATARIAENIQHKIDKANYLADDLQFMIEKGGKIADKMEGGISSGRVNATRPAPAAPAQPQPQARPAQSYIDDEPAARPASRRPESRPAPEASGGGGDKARSSLDSMLKRVSGRSEAEAPASDPRRQQRPGARLRSKAEQELFDALKSGNDKV